VRGDVDEIGRWGSRWRGEDRSRLPEVYDDGARPMLHARSLGFVHPVSGEEINFAVAATNPLVRYAHIASDDIAWRVFVNSRRQL